MTIFGNPLDKFYGPPEGEWSGEYQMRVNCALERQIIEDFITTSQRLEDSSGRTVWVLEKWAKDLDLDIEITRLDDGSWQVILKSSELPWLF